MRCNKFLAVKCQQPVFKHVMSAQTHIY